VLIYGWVGVLVYKVLRKLVGVVRSLGFARDDGVCGNDWAFWGAVAFTVLPIHTEAVNNIVGRAEMLSLGFLLLAVLASYKNKWEMSSLWIFLAMLSKETAAVGIPVLLYIILTKTKVEKREKIGAGVFIVMALCGFLLMRTVVLKGVGSGNNATMVENPLKFMPTEMRVKNAIALIPFGVSKILFPVSLSYDYSYNQLKPVGSWLDWRVVLGVGMILASGVRLLWFGLPKRAMTKKESTEFDTDNSILLVVGMMMFWGPILITGNILFPIGTIFGERLWFMPSLGVVMILVFFIQEMRLLWFGLPKRAMTIVFILISILFAGRTVMRNLDWLSQERLFLHDAQYVTQSVMAQNNAAAMYLMKRNLTGAKILMEEASEIYPKYPELLNNWGLYYLWTGKPEDASKKFEECLVARPGNGLCQGNLELVK
jgi:hypothetical protein